MSTFVSIQEHKTGIMVLADESQSALPLEHTEYNAQVTGVLATVAVIQRFGNPLPGPAELIYLFPLPHEAAIIGFEFRVGSRKICGKIEERERAAEQYEDARESGRRAGLLVEHRPNLFSIALANVLPGETIEARLQYSQRVKLEDGQFEFVIPMGITPRYQDPALPIEPDINPPVAESGEPTSTVEVNLSVDAGTAIGEPESPSHAIQVIRQDPARLMVRLGGEHIADHDFVVRYVLQGSSVQANTWTSKEEGGNIFTAVLVPPAVDGEMKPPLRELVFVIDRSGSMSGEPIAQARNALKACLRSLFSTDTFRILTFDTELEWFSPEPVAAGDEERIKQADLFLDQVDGRGGTDIMGALQAALGLPEDLLRQRFVIFLTDGAVSAEEHTLSLLKKKIGKNRVFTFGIGPSVNRSLLDKMASAGRGWSEFLGADEDIEGAILRFHDRIAFPMLSGLTLTTRDIKTWDLMPSQMPDLYAGPALEICGRWTKTGPSPALIINGTAGGSPVELVAELPEAAQSVPVVRSVWAKARADALLNQINERHSNEEKIRSQVIQLSLEYGFVTPYTSFVAVDEGVVTDGKPRKIRVSQPLPEGLEREGFGILHMKMATSFGAPLPAELYQAGPDRMVIEAHPAFSASLDGQLDFSDRMQEPDIDEPTRIGEIDEGLRSYARTQESDGSWGHDIELTAAVLLAFVRNGKTTRKGEFRRSLQKAYAWLEAQKGTSGFAAFTRALALHELAQQTHQADHIQAAGEALQNLPAAATDEEKLAAELLNGGSPSLGESFKVTDLSSSRAAGLTSASVRTIQVLNDVQDDPLILAWLHCCRIL